MEILLEGQTLNVMMKGESTEMSAIRKMSPNSTADAPRRDDTWSTLLCRIGENQDEQAFAELFGHFAPLIKGFYLSNSPRLGAEEAEELVQEVLCKVWLKAASFDAVKSSASTWIYTIARNARIDYLRKTANKAALTDELESEDIWDESADNQPFVSLIQARDKTDVSDMLNQLPIEQKQCLVKMYMEGKSHAQLAEDLQLPLGTVKSRIRLGLKRLQAWMPAQRGM